MLEKTTKPHSKDLDGFKPSPPDVRIDDKAARLEEELQDLKRRMNNERFAFSLITTTFFVLLVGALNPWLLIAAVPSGYLILLTLGHVFDFPHINEEIRELIRKGTTSKLPKPPTGTEPT